MRFFLACLSTSLMLGFGAACKPPPDEPSKTVSDVDTTETVVRDTSSRNLGPGRPDTFEVESGVWSASAREDDHAVSGVATISDIRIATHEDYDRAVLQFQGKEVPAYSVKYLNEPIVECGSGHSIELAGNHALEIRLAPARGYTDEGKSTINHERRSPDLPVVKEAEISCDFEANFTLVAGIEGRRPFRVQTFENPSRLVVDIQHLP